MLHRAAHRRSLTTAVCVLLAATAPSVAAQDRSPVVQQAIEQRDAGQLEAAVRTLGPYVARTPGDVEAARVLAQTLYWLKRTDDARTIYGSAQARHPQDAALALEFGRLLAETGDGTRARALASPFAADPVWGARARALLGTIAYWKGDFTAARRSLRSALQADPSLEETRRQLGEIAALTAPWISVYGQMGADDQPVTRREAQLAGGVHVTPLLSLTARAGMRDIASGDTVSLGVRTAEGGFSHYLPALRLETQAVGGVLQRDGADAEWIGRAHAGLRLPRHVTIRGVMEREPYLYTVASLRTPVLPQTATALIALASPRGWLGEAAVQRATFPDDNAVRTIYGWLLAPLANTPQARFQAGYGVTYQDADESRFVLADRSQSFPPGDPRFNTSGVYAPYFTPAQLIVHSVLVNGEVRAGRVTLRAGGGYGVWTFDYEPVFVTPPGSPVAQRSFQPRAPKSWNVRGGMDIAATDALTFMVSGDAMQAAFFRSVTGRAGLTWRAAGAAARRATR